MTHRKLDRFVEVDPRVRSIFRFDDGEKAPPTTHVAENFRRKLAATLASLPSVPSFGEAWLRGLGPLYDDLRIATFRAAWDSLHAATPTMELDRRTFLTVATTPDDAETPLVTFYGEKFRNGTLVGASDPHCRRRLRDDEFFVLLATRNDHLTAPERRMHGHPRRLRDEPFEPGFPHPDFVVDLDLFRGKRYPWKRRSVQRETAEMRRDVTTRRRTGHGDDDMVLRNVASEYDREGKFDGARCPDWRRLCHRSVWYRTSAAPTYARDDGPVDRELRIP
jgi:hypothetical protein